MEKVRREITQDEFDALVSHALNEEEKTADYWSRQQETVSYTVRVPNESAIDNSSFYGYGYGDFERDDVRQKEVTTYTLNLDVLLAENGFLPQMFPRIIHEIFFEEKYIRINSQRCPDKLMPLNEADKTEIEKSILSGRYKITRDKFRALVATPAAYTLDEMEKLYKAIHKSRDYFKVMEYANIIFEQYPLVDRERQERNRQERQTQASLLQYWGGAQRDRQRERDGGEGQAKKARVESPGFSSNKK